MVDAGPTIIMQWLNFGILLFLLYKFLYNPLLTFLDNRSQSIASEIEAASVQREEATQLLEQYNSKLSNIEVEADKIFNDIRKKALEEKQRIMTAAKLEAQRTIDSAKRDIELELSRAKEELKNQIASLVVTCSSKVLEREINANDHQRFIDDFINN